jgi:hypothetical protein
VTPTPKSSGLSIGGVTGVESTEAAHPGTQGKKLAPEYAAWLKHAETLQKPGTILGERLKDWFIKGERLGLPGSNRGSHVFSLSKSPVKEP